MEKTKTQINQMNNCSSTNKSVAREDDEEEIKANMKEVEEEMKLEIPSMAKCTSIAAPLRGGGLSRQGSIAKNNCLCSPTTHAGSFRCRLHRTPTLHMDS